MWARNGVAIEECQELAKSIKERPVGEQTDTLVGVDRAGVGGGCAAGGGAVSGCSCSVGGGGGGFVWIQAQEAELGELLIGQTLLRVGLVELNGSTIHLKQETCWLHSFPRAVISC